MPDHVGQAMSLSLGNPLFRLKGEEDYADEIHFALRNFDLPDDIDEAQLYYFSTFFPGPVEVLSRTRTAKEKFMFRNLGFTVKMKLQVQSVKTLEEGAKLHVEGERVIGEELCSTIETSVGMISLRNVIGYKPAAVPWIQTRFSAQLQPGWTLYKPKTHVRKLRGEVPAIKIRICQEQAVFRRSALNTRQHLGSSAPLLLCALFE